MMLIGHGMAFISILGFNLITDKTIVTSKLMDEELIEERKKWALIAMYGMGGMMIIAFMISLFIKEDLRRLKFSD